MVSRDITVASDTDEDTSDGNEFKGAGLLAGWLHDSRSKLNTTSTAYIQRTGSFLWAFGENENRALSVQQKQTQIDWPFYSKIPLKESSNSEEDKDEDQLVQIASADCHSAAVTLKGHIYTVGSNRHH